MVLLPKQFQSVGDSKLMRAIESKLEVVEKRIQEATSHTESMVDSMANHLAAAGGKRLRPVLVLLTSHLGDAENQDVLDAAVVMEITHLATLYHDDVMDQAQTRRGVDAAPFLQKIQLSNIFLLLLISLKKEKNLCLECI